MRFFRKHPVFTKLSILATLSSGSAWCYFQVRRTRDILNNALDTSVLNLDSPFTKSQRDDFFVIDINKTNERQDLTFDTTWSSLKFAIAKRLLLLASHDNRYIRTKAVRQLSKITNLDYWQFEILSTMIDARTAVALARTENVDSRWFSEPPLRYLTHTQNMIVDVMKDLLVNLHARSQHPCMGYFISKAFVDLHDIDRFADHDSTNLELKKFMQKTHEVIPMCLESLVHHASVENYAKDIAELNGLPLLREIYNRFRGDIDVTAIICRIISYLSMHKELLDDLFKTGWIGILSEWRKHSDVRISIPAAKALANLDHEENSLYLQRLYILHPSIRSFKNIEADVVFVHGLLGGVFYTWRQRTKAQEPPGLIESLSPETCVPIPTLPEISNPEVGEYNVDEDDSDSFLNFDFTFTECDDFDVVWDDLPTNTNQHAEGPYSCPSDKFNYNPSRSKLFNKKSNDYFCYTSCWPRDWLAQDCENLRIIGVNYETNLSLWTSMCPVEKVKTLEERSDELIQQMGKIGLGRRPIIWVTHSMGGLMVKSLLSKAYESSDTSIRNMCLNTKGIVFYSTPHVGSSVARFNQASALVIWPSVEVQELQQDSPKLVEIHKKFLDLIEKNPIKVVTFIETKPTIVTAMKLKFLIVEPKSGNPGVGEYYEIPLDHLGICKPSCRHSFLYRKVLHLISDVLGESTGKKTQFGND